MRITSRASGFTLAELLTVLGILMVLGALLFPVFRASRAAAYRTACASNFKQDVLAANLYLADYDEVFMPVNHAPGLMPDPVADRTWVQLLLPYTKSFSIFICPSDYGRRAENEAVFDEKLVLSDTTVRYYHASLRVNHGYNYLYYSPVVMGRFGWEVHPRNASAVGERALLFADSVHVVSGRANPGGGGSYVVIPPCRFALSDGDVVDTFRLPPGARVFAASEGWVLKNPISELRYGFAWPWHDGRVNIARVSGGTVSLNPMQLAEGCDLRESWGGLIRDSDRYVWNGD